LADRFTGSPYTPPSAPLTQAEKVRYFANMIWTPDGEPNLPGRDALEQKHGWQGFAGILTHLSKAHGPQHPRLADQDPLPARRESRAWTGRRRRGPAPPPPRRPGGTPCRAASAYWLTLRGR